MLKLYAIEFTSNLAVELWGERRKPYKAGDRVLITRDERLMLLRLGCKQLGEKEVNVDDVFTDKDFNGLPERVAFQNAKVPTEVKKGKNDKAEKVEAPKVEELAPAETQLTLRLLLKKKLLQKLLLVRPELMLKYKLLQNQLLLNLKQKKSNQQHLLKKHLLKQQKLLQRTQKRINNIHFYGPCRSPRS